MRRSIVFLIVVVMLFALVMPALAQDPMPVPNSGGIPRQFGDGAFLNDVEPVKEERVSWPVYQMCHWIPDPTRPQGGTFECYWVKFPPGVIEGY